MKTKNTHFHLKTPKQKSAKYHGFTLVELIVTISILAILGTMGFIQMNGHINASRDSTRITDIQSIQQGLAILYAKTGAYPLPENSVTVMAGSTVLSYQGYVWDSVSRALKINKIPLDPKDATQYIYTLDGEKKKAQLMGYLESGDTLKSTSYGDALMRLVDQSYAAVASNVDYKNRLVYVTGDKVWMIVDGNKAPIQESVSGTGVDLAAIDTTGYVAYFGWDAYGKWQTTGTGDVLVSQVLWAQTNAIPCNPMSYSGYTISALVNKETRIFTKPINVGNGVGTGSLQIQCLNGVLDTSHATDTTSVSCNTNYVNQANVCVLDVCGGTVPVNAQSTATSQTVSQNWTRSATAGVCTYDCMAYYEWDSGSNSCITTIPAAPSVSGTVRCGAGNATVTATPPAGSTIDWYTAATGGTPVAIGATSYSPTLSNTTTFYAESRNTANGATSTTRTAVTATVDAVPVGGTATWATQRVCAGTNMTMNLSGQSGTIDRWQYSPNGGAWVDWGNAGATSINWSPTTNHSFRAVLKNGSCAETYSAPTGNSTVDPQTVGGTMTAGPNPVSYATNTTLAISGQVGAVQQWEYYYTAWTAWGVGTPTSVVWQAFPGYYFRALIKSGVCPAAYSSQVYVTVNPPTYQWVATANFLTYAWGSQGTIACVRNDGAVIKYANASQCPVGYAAGQAATWCSCYYSAAGGSCGDVACP